MTGSIFTLPERSNTVDLSKESAVRLEDLDIVMELRAYIMALLAYIEAL